MARDDDSGMIAFRSVLARGYTERSSPSFPSAIGEVVYARISRLTAPASEIEAVGRFEEDFVGRLCEHSGYRGSMLLAHPDDGTCITITYWDSEDAMRDCDDLAARRVDPCLDAVRARSIEWLELVREG